MIFMSFIYIVIRKGLFYPPLMQAPFLCSTILCFLKVGAKDLMDIGDIIFLPTTIDVKSRSTKHENENLCNEGMKFIRGLELFKVLISVNCFSSICCQMLKFL